MHHPSFRRLLAIAGTVALTVWASMPTSLLAAPSATAGASSRFLAGDLLDRVNHWLDAIWPWHSSPAGPATHLRAVTPHNGCVLDPNGQCTGGVVTPHNGCLIDPDGQQCTGVVTPHNGCGMDPNGQQCTQAVTLH